MLQIRKSSWHWKLNHYVWGERVNGAMSHSLCPYFWGLILAIVGVPFVAFFRKVGEDMVLGGTLTGIMILFVIVLYFVFIKVGAIIFIVGSLSFIGFAVLLSISISEPSDREYKHKEKKTRKPNIAWEMVKATKNKYCPMIQVID